MDDHIIRLEPPRATHGELQLTNRLEMRRIDTDVLGVVEALQRIDRGLKMYFDEGQEVFVLYWEGFRPDHQGNPGWHEDLVGAYRELDQRIVGLIERIDREGRGRADLNAELERLERAREREMASQRHEHVGPIAERLLHAVRDDLGLGGSVVHLHRGRKGKRRR
jgi:hypothetical protein